MKNLPRTILISILPLLTPLAASADTGRQAEQLNPAHDREGGSGSSRATEIIGLDVRNADRESIGEVEDLVIDMKSGEIIAVIISSGAFLGTGETLSALPLTVLRYGGKAGGFETRLTKEQLGGAPRFKAAEFPDYGDSASSDALRAFRDSIGGDLNAPDNTARNERDRNDDALTPMDQGNSPEDLKITRDIRSAIMDTDMSSNAKNIKIITRNELVTLRGVVDSVSEHQAVLEIAGKHGEKAKITDNLEVNSN